MNSESHVLASKDVTIAKIIAGEERRQTDHLELIASENYVSAAVQEAQGSILSNKYAEGYPGKRYYSGCEFVDEIEEVALRRIKKLFSCDYANVQPHSGSQANAAVYLALANPGDTILGMGLSDGGHLTHGFKLNFSGRGYNCVSYGVNKTTGLIDYDEIEALAILHHPKILIGGFSAYSRVVDWARLRAIADKVGAYLWVDIAHVAGLIAAGVYPDPLSYAHVATTTTHKTLRGPRGGLILTRGQSKEFNAKIDSAVFPGIQGGPAMHIIAAKAVSFKEALTPEFIQYQKQVLVNAQAMVKVFKERGYHVVSGKTDNHMFLLDFSMLSFTGKEADELLARAAITTNKNTVPNEVRSPFITSGIRIGTPAMTSRGFKEAESVLVANYICDLLDSFSSDKERQAQRVQEIRMKILALTAEKAIPKSYC